MTRCLLFVLCIVSLLFAACDKDKSQASQAAKTGEQKVQKVEKKEEPKGVEIKLGEAEKQYLIQLARKTFDQWVTKKTRYVPADVPANLKDMSANRVFATIYKEGEWRGCVSAEEKNLIESTIGSVINTCKDNRFKSPEPGELDKFRVELSFLQPMEEVTTKDPAEIEKVLEPGVHGIQVRHTSGKGAFFLPYVFVKKQRTTITWLERLSEKGGLPKDAWKSPEASIYKYSTINFIEDKPYGRAVDLYRYKIELDALEPDAINQALALGKTWLLEHKDETTKRFAAGFDGDHKPLSSVPESAQAMAAAALGSMADVNKDKDLAKDVRWIQDGLQTKLTKQDGGLAFVTDGKADIEGTLIVADFLSQAITAKDRNALAKSLAANLSKSLTSGTLPGKGAIIEDLPNYAIYVFSRLATLTKLDADKITAKKLFEGQWKPGQVWSLAAAVAAANLTGDSTAKGKAATEASALLDAQYTKENARFSDYVGAFKGEKIPTTEGVAVRLLGLSQAFGAGMIDPAVRSKATDALVFGVRWLLEQQFTPQSAFYIENGQTMWGTFKQDILENTSILDQSSLALLALAEVKRNLGTEWASVLPRLKEDLVK